MKKQMLTIKEYLLKQEISKETFDSMTAEETVKVFNGLQENNIAAFKELQEKGATSEELAKAVEAMSKESAEKLEKVLLAMEKGSEAQKQQGLALAKLMKAGSPAERDC